MQPTGLSNEDAETVLRLLDLLGILVWMDQPELRNLVLLNPRRVAVAMATLMTICFGQGNFEHGDMMLEPKGGEHRGDFLRFQSTGIATRKLIRGLWTEDPRVQVHPSLVLHHGRPKFEAAPSYSSKPAG